MGRQSTSAAQDGGETGGAGDRGQEGSCVLEPMGGRTGRAREGAATESGWDRLRGLGSGPRGRDRGEWPYMGSLPRAQCSP